MDIFRGPWLCGWGCRYGEQGQSVFLSPESGIPAAVGPGPLTDRDKYQVGLFSCISHQEEACDVVLSVHLHQAACGSAIAEVFQGHDIPMGLGHARSWLWPAPAAPGQASAGCCQGRGTQGSSWGSPKGQTLQETTLTGSQKPLHHCLSLFIPSCLLTRAQLTWHSGKPNLIFRLREPSDLHCFQTDFIKESSMPSCQLEETQTFAKLWLRNRVEKEHRSRPGYSTWLRVWPGMSHQVPRVA